MVPAAVNTVDVPVDGIRFGVRVLADFLEHA